MATPADHHAIILIGHGSLRSAGGASMIRIAARLRERGAAPVVEAAFLNYSRPTLAEVVAKVVDAGAVQITIQPYFLIAGAYVQDDLAALIREVAAANPALTFTVAPVLGEHPALAELAQVRAAAALVEARAEPARPHLLLLAHGTPLPEANAPLYRTADQIATWLGLPGSTVAYLDCNAPTIPGAFADLAHRGVTQVLALPYFLHLGRHVAQDLPALINQARADYPALTVLAAQHLDYDLRLVNAIQALVTQAAPLVPAPSETIPSSAPAAHLHR
jgi:sirohydrochlorin cobaltochelatase